MGREFRVQWDEGHRVSLRHLLQHVGQDLERPGWHGRLGLLSGLAAQDEAKAFVAVGEPGEGLAGLAGAARLLLRESQWLGCIRVQSDHWNLLRKRTSIPGYTISAIDATSESDGQQIICAKRSCVQGGPSTYWVNSIESLLFRDSPFYCRACERRK